MQKLFLGPKDARRGRTFWVRVVMLDVVVGWYTVWMNEPFPEAWGRVRFTPGLLLYKQLPGWYVGVC